MIAVVKSLLVPKCNGVDAMAMALQIFRHLVLEGGGDGETKDIVARLSAL